MSKETLKVGGMSCGHCEAAIKKALTGLNGVEEVTVNLNKKTVETRYDEALISLSAIKKAIEDQGYEIL
ncbi:MAG: copper chaperone CopZ [Clostridiales bacterium]|jgi:copper chaperone|nr:copper chaperone CopZ [Clostridiales bacterium]